MFRRLPRSLGRGTASHQSAPAYNMDSNGWGTRSLALSALAEPQRAMPQICVAAPGRRQTTLGPSNVYVQETSISLLKKECDSSKTDDCKSPNCKLNASLRMGGLLARTKIGNPYSVGSYDPNLCAPLDAPNGICCFSALKAPRM